MRFAHPSAVMPTAATLLLGACGVLLPLPARSQDSSAESGIRGNRPELSITVRDSSGEPISAPATVKVSRMGIPADQRATRKGRVFFILDSLGDYTIAVDATGYQAAQKEVSLTIALKA